MEKQRTLALLRVNAEGRVSAANETAERWLGPAVGRPCQSVVGACGEDGAPICREGCAAGLARTGSDMTSEPDARVRQRSTRLECRRVGSDVVVVIEPRHNHVERVHTRLSPREQEVLALVAQGKTAKQIAVCLELRPSTVRTHLEHARDRLGARSLAEAVARWLTEDSVD